MYNIILKSFFFWFLGHLNWWADAGVCRRLVPLATVGDGNCLLHAASLGMWGFHDRLLTLRKALYCTLTSHLAKGAIKRRWRLEQWQKNIKAGGLLYSEEEWEKEWLEVLRIASTQRRDHEHITTEKNKEGENISTLASILEKYVESETSDVPVKEESTHSPADCQQNDTKDCDKGNDKSTEHEKLSDKEVDEEGRGAFESLEDIHVFVLAHVLRRPIIIIADQFLYGFGGEPIAPIPFGGVYLPLECDPPSCLKSPLVLAFESAHFSPLVPSDEKNGGKTSSLKAAVPLVGPSYDLLSLKFAVDPGEDFLWSSLDEKATIPDELELSMNKKLELLKKYLNVENVKLPNTGKKDNPEDKKTATKGEKSEVSSDAANKPGSKSPTKSAEKKEKSWIATQIMKVGTMAGMVGGVVHSNIYVARLQTDKKPEYYEKMIENYIESAKERFEEEKKAQTKATKGAGSSGEKPQPCINPGCQLYGTSATNYLCSGCYKTQKSYSETGRYLVGAGSSSGREPQTNYDNGGVQSYFPPPSYSAYVPYGYFGDYSRTQGSNVEQKNTVEAQQPTQVSLPSGTSHSRKETGKELPSYAEVMKLGKTTALNLPSSTSGHSTAQSASSSIPVRCITDNCPYFGSPQNKGYCSGCYKAYQKTLKCVIEESEKSQSKVV